MPSIPSGSRRKSSQVFARNPRARGTAMLRYILNLGLGVCLVGSALAQGAPQWRGPDKSDSPLEGKVYDRYALGGKWLTSPAAPDAASHLPEMRVFCYEAKIGSLEIDFGTVLKHYNPNIPFGPSQNYIVRVDSKKPKKINLDANISGNGTVVVVDDLIYEDILGAKRVVFGATEKGSERELAMEFQMPDPSPLLDRCSRSLKRLK
jgi:hypothetical protein